MIKVHRCFYHGHFGCKIKGTDQDNSAYRIHPLHKISYRQVGQKSMLRDTKISSHRRVSDASRNSLGM